VLAYYFPPLEFSCLSETPMRNSIWEEVGKPGCGTAVVAEPGHSGTNGTLTGQLIPG
jgi:hypothetical protein